MSHASTAAPFAPGLSKGAPPATSSSRLPPRSTAGDWKYRTPRHGRPIILLAVFVSALLHLVVLYGFNRRPPKQVAKAVDDTAVVQLVMPELKDLDEPEPVEDLSGDEAAAAAVPVPLLMDTPTMVPVNAFVQPLDFHPPLDANLSGANLTSIPVHIARGGNVAEKLGKVFDLSQLDRVPEPIVQAPPLFPVEMKDVESAEVAVEFIVDSHGNVQDPFVRATTERGFEEAAIKGVSKWKFRPGIKSGRKVNTRMRVTILFRIADST